MRKQIGILYNPDGIKGPMEIYFNGDGEPMTAETDEVSEECCYTPDDLDDAVEAAMKMWSGPWWVYETVAKWYAVMSDPEDYDWGTGSYDFEKAKEMLKPYIEDGGYIAVIDVMNNGDPICVDEIHITE